jgi:hypothetical protein
MMAITLIHPTGPILLTEPQARIIGDRAEFIGTVSASDWERVEDLDIFGTASRTRSPGSLPPGDSVRITIATAAEDAITMSEASGGASEAPADRFVILDAMRAVAIPSSMSAEADAEIWEGLVFTDPAPWNQALAALAEEGFEPFQGLASATTVLRESDGLSVEFRHFDAHDISRVQVVSPLPMGDAVAPDTFVFLNRLNATLPFSAVVVDAGDLIVRETVPDELGIAAGGLIASRALTLVNLMGEVLEPTLAVANGQATAAEALAALFG